MPARRSSTRLSTASTIQNRPLATPSSQTRHKRQLSSPNTNSGSKGTPSTVKRAKAHPAESSSNTTPRKSKYFEDPDSEPESSGSPSAEDLEAESGYEDISRTSSISSSEADISSDSSFDARRKGNTSKSKVKSSNDRPKGVIAATISKGQELWREGIKVGLGPGKEVFIEKPKPRGDGGIKYVNDRIHPNTFAFLADLKQNNDREWFKMHDPDYRASKKDWDTFVEALTQKIMELDDTIPELPPKDLTFRIFRDIRFSKDPTPYKPHFSAAWSRTGRKGPYAAYYVQIAPENSFVGSGLWMPEAAPLAALRQNVDRSPQRLKRVLMDPVIRKDIFGGVKNDEKKAVHAFVAQNAENALKTKPKDFDANHPDIEILRLRNYTMGRKLEDKEVLGGKGLGNIADLIAAMVPWVNFLNSVVMPDEDDGASGLSDDSNDDDQGGDST